MIIDEKRAAELLLQGEVVALPTETVFGLAASVKIPKAIEKVFEIKGRPKGNPLILHLLSMKEATSFIESLPDHFEELKDSFTPGPLTLVMKIKPGSLPGIITAGLPHAAFRAPSHATVRRILEMTGPLVMPSANVSGRPSSTETAHIETDFGQDFPVVRGEVQKGLESTILGFFDGVWRLLRQGAIPADAFKNILGYTPKLLHGASEIPLSPGQMFRHYAPKASLEFGDQFKPGDVVLGFNDLSYPEGTQLIYLGRTDEPDAVALRLYAALRELDLDGIQKAIIDSRFPSVGLFITIRERLKRAIKK